MAANPLCCPFLRSSPMTAPTARRQAADSSPASGQQAQAQAHRQAHNRRKARAKAKNEARRQREAAQVEALPVQHPHAAGIDIGSRSHWVCVGFTSRFFHEETLESLFYAACLPHRSPTQGSACC